MITEKRALVTQPEVGEVSPDQKWFLRLFLLSLILPEILEFLFFGSPAARLARLGILGIAGLQQIGAVRKGAQLEGPKLLSLILYACLVVTGVISFLLNAGVFPIYMFSALIWLFLIARQNDGPKLHLDQVVRAAQILTLLSTVAILLKLNNPFAFSQSNSSQYFVPFNDVLGLSGRQSGILSHANQLAPVCVVAIVGALVSRKSLWQVPIYLFTLLTTGSTTSYISACVGILFVYYGSGKFFRVITRSWVKALLAVIFVATLSIVTSFWTINISNTLLTGRGFIWNQALLLLNNHWLFGLGWQFERTAIAQGILPPFAASVHNTYLEWLTNFGIVGIALILPTFILFLRNLSSANARLRSLSVTVLLFSFSESLINFGVFNVFTFAFMLCVWSSSMASNTAAQAARVDID